jgi:Ca-activated chloride channel family protein
MADQIAPARTGLLTKDLEPVALTGIAITADVRSLCAKVTVAQRYVNRESQPIEAVYVFPLDEGAAVCGFEAIIDGTLVVGEVKPRDEAFRLYDDAIETGHGAYLLDEERPDVFQASVGNLPPGKEVLLKITYVSELGVDGEALRFVIPTTVSPRYAPHVDQIGVGRPDAATLNPPVAWRVPYGLDLSVRLAMPGTITRVESPSHPISIATDDSGTTVSLSQQHASLDRDFVLSVSGAGLEVPRAWIERGDDGRHAIAVGFVPALNQKTSPVESIFVIDRSGSMQGSSIAEVRNALQLCLRSMTRGCRFNIIGFGSTFESLFPESRPYDEASLSEASAHARSLDADLGGTEILPALEAALQGRPHVGLPRQVVILTDGQVSNTDAVIALVRSHRAHARVFTFGIGAGASHHLVQGIARAAGGASEFVAPGERIEPKVLRLFGRLLTPALTEIRLDWGGLSVVAAPSEMPPIVAGARVVLYGFVDGLRPTTLRLTANAPSGPLAFDVPIDPVNVTPGTIVSTLAARARIRELEESPDWLQARGSRQQRSRVSGASQEIIDLAVRYGLASRETSFVAVERREQTVTGDIQLRRVPIALTNGWGGMDALRLHLVHAALAAPPAAAPMWTRTDAMPSPLRAVSDVASGWISRVAGGAAQPSSTRRAGRDTPRTSTLHDAHDGRKGDDDNRRARMLGVVSLQRADGSWDLTEDLARALGQSLAKLQVAHIGATGNPEEAGRAWATALALQWLEADVPALVDEWRLVAMKARVWLDAVTARPAGRRTWSDEAARHLRSLGR